MSYKELWWFCYCSVTKSCPTLCNLMDCNMPGFPVLHCLLEFAQTHVHWVGDAIQPSHPRHPLLLLPSIFPRIRVLILNWCFWIVVLEKTLESPLDCKEIKPVHPKGNQLWIFIGRTGAEAEAPILLPPDVNSQLTEKDPDAGKDWGQDEKWVTDDEMVGWHHRLNGHEFEQTPGDSEG